MPHLFLPAFVFIFGFNFQIAFLPGWPVTIDKFLQMTSDGVQALEQCNNLPQPGNKTAYA